MFPLSKIYNSVGWESLFSAVQETEAEKGWGGVVSHTVLHRARKSKAETYTPGHSASKNCECLLWLLDPPTLDP